MIDSDAHGVVAPLQNSTWQHRWAQLLERLTLVSSEEQLEPELLASLMQPKKPITLAFVNAHAMNIAASDSEFTQSLLHADYLLRDGAGMRILLKLMHRDPGLNLNGTDLIPQLLRRYAGQRIALFGTVEPWLSKASQQVQQLAAPTASVTLADGYRCERAYLERASRDQPDLIVLGMGMPKQEATARILQTELTHPCLIVCGGAIIDFMGGRVERAPEIYRALGLEWLYRLSKEPKRLFRRYVLGNPVFLFRVVTLASKQKLKNQ